MTDAFTLHHGDCLDVLRDMPDASVDAVVTDPPYGLSDNSTNGSRDPERIMLEVVLPDCADLYAGAFGDLELPVPIGGVALLDIMLRSLWEKSRVCMPECPVKFDGDVDFGQKDVKDAGVPATAIPDRKLVDGAHSKVCDNIHDFTFAFASFGDASVADGLTGCITELGFGRLSVRVIIPFKPSFSGLLCSLLPRDTSFVRNVVRSGDVSGYEALPSGFVVTGSGAEYHAVFSFDLSGALVSVAPAVTAFQDGAAAFLVPSQLIAASSGASCLATKFQSRDISFVGDPAGRAFSVNIHKEIIAAATRRRKGFMGKEWDYDVPTVAIWSECLRALKPGGHLLSFGGSRTYHRMAVNVEDAGFEIRDQVMWVYGSGFPKSHNISKAIDKAAGAEREVVGFDAQKAAQQTPNAGLVGFSGAQGSNGDITAPATPAAQQWDGWGSALKPAHEPVVLARKPLGEKTLAANVLKHGTGAINVDGCRVEGRDRTEYGLANSTRGRGSTYGHPSPNADFDATQGRFPANLIHDGSDEVLAGFPNENARFFYCAKASKSDRGERNIHPTVKPTDLMAYLCRLVTPPGGVVLDPFMGSGSTGKAAIREGFQFIGIEREAEYLAIARARIEAAHV